jgi:tetratricopeptide (TPR) repeat protein
MPNETNFDALWDYSNPEGTERKFRAVLAGLPPNDSVALELLTQIARAQGLQRRFDAAHQTLDEVEKQLGDSASRTRIRYLLERGRALNSSGSPDRARPLFEEAEQMAMQLSEDFLAVDAIHMLAILAEPSQGLGLNLRAINRAESSEEEKARNWLGSLYNNTGWSYHDLGDYESALDMFRKAEAWQKSKGRGAETRIAKWTVARTLRSMKRFEEALSRQRELEKEFEFTAEEDGYVFEEIAECLLGLNRPDEAGPYFAIAYLILSKDEWLAEKEPVRLQRLKQLGNVE